MARRRRMTALQRKYFAPRRRRRRRRRAVHSNRYRPYRRRRRVVHYNENVGRPRRRRRRHNRYRARRRHYSNPRAGASLAIGRPQTWLVPVVAAGTGAATSAAITRWALGPGAAPPMSYLVEMAVGAAGWVALPMTGFVRPMTGFFFFLGSAAPVVSDIVARYLFRALGLSAYAYDTAGELADMGQEPRFPPTLSAYAYELSDPGWGDAPTIGADDTMGDLAAYGGGSPYFGYGGAMPRAPWETAGPGGY